MEDAPRVLFRRGADADENSRSGTGGADGSSFIRHDPEFDRKFSFATSVRSDSALRSVRPTSPSSSTSRDQAALARTVARRARPPASPGELRELGWPGAPPARRAPRPAAPKPPFAFPLP